MKARRYRVTVSGYPVVMLGRRWGYDTPGLDGRLALTSSEAAMVKREAFRVGAVFSARPVVTPVARPARKARGRALPTKAARRARMLRNLAKGRATRKANLKKRNR